MNPEESRKIPGRIDLIRRALEAAGYPNEAGLAVSVGNHVAALERELAAGAAETSQLRHRCEEMQGRIDALSSRRHHHGEDAD